MFPLGYGRALLKPSHMWSEDGRLDVGAVARISTDGETLLVAKSNDTTTHSQSALEEEAKSPPTGRNEPFRPNELLNLLPDVLWGVTIQAGPGTRVKHMTDNRTCTVARHAFKLNNTTGSFLVTERAEHRFVPNTERDTLMPYAARQLLMYRDVEVRDDPDATAAQVEQWLVFVTGTVKAARYYAAHVKADAPGGRAVLHVSLNEYCEYECDCRYEPELEGEHGGGLADNEDDGRVEEEEVIGKHVSRTPSSGSQPTGTTNIEPVIRRYTCNAMPPSELMAMTELTSTLFVHYCKIKTRESHVSSRDVFSSSGDHAGIPFDPVQTILEYILQESEETTLAIASDADVLALFPDNPPADNDLRPDSLAIALARRTPGIATESVETHTVGRLLYSRGGGLMFAE
ncbi:hypothetical protein BC628DRAFT_852440 [Trametes gibbosa]|nr:hypothetical protein BC628DRAFT_852440 [Trametes gibbosa]